MKHSIFAVTGLGLLSSVSSAALIQGPVVNPDNGHSYYLLSPSTWTAAEADAVSLGGHLVTINNAAENEFVYNSFGTDPFFVGRLLWLGYNDAATEGTFVWSSGETPGYTNWYPNQPDDDGFGLIGPQDYTLMFGGFSFGGAARFWDDDTNTGSGNSLPAYGVVEVVPEPTALAVSAVAAFTLGRRRRPVVG